MNALRAYLWSAFVVALGNLAVACTDYPASVAPRGDPYAYLRPEQTGSDTITPGARTTWHKDVRRVVEANCVRCHNDEGIAPMSLESYAAAEPYFDTMAAHVESGYMPPWQFDEECHDLAVVRGLSDEARATFSAWKEDGFAEGKEADYIAPPAPAAFDPSGEVEVAMTRATYTASGDEARCFLLSQKVTADASLDPRGWWVTDVRFAPDQADQIQQATLYMLSPDETAAVSGDDAGYACDDGAGTDSEVTVAAWVPGQMPTSFAQETALLVPYWSRFVLRIRYRASHLATVPPDATSVSLWRYGGKRTPNVAQVRLATVRATGTAPLDTYLGSSQTILGIIPEMAPGGGSLKLEYFIGPAGTCLAESDRWDPRFPETLIFAEGRTTKAILGYTTRLSCSYDDGTPAPACRATLVSTVPRYDSIQPFGQTCSGVEGCLLSCASSATCLLDCIAWEQPACGECARRQLFQTCAMVANPIQYNNLAACETANCAAADGFPGWLSCMLDKCKSQLVIMQTALESALPEGTCNRDSETCVYMVPSEP